MNKFLIFIFKIFKVRLDKIIFFILKTFKIKLDATIWFVDKFVISIMQYSFFFLLSYLFDNKNGIYKLTFFLFIFSFFIRDSLEKYSEDLEEKHNKRYWTVLHSFPLMCFIATTSNLIIYLTISKFINNPFLLLIICILMAFNSIDFEILLNLPMGLNFSHPVAKIIKEYYHTGEKNEELKEIINNLTEQYSEEMELLVQNLKYNKNHAQVNKDKYICKTSFYEKINKMLVLISFAYEENKRTINEL